jgi:hypothetical protein
MPLRHWVLHNPKLDILIAECLIVPFIKRFPNIIIVISIINIIQRLGLVIVRVFRVIYWI